MSEAEAQLKQYYVHREYPTDSQEYQDSLDIYLSLRSLLQRGIVEPLDIQVVDAIISGFSFRKTGRTLNLDRRSVQSRYKKVITLLDETLEVSL